MRIGAPPNYLGKLLGQLSKAGLVEGRKGAGGGFRLAKGSENISLYDILESIESVVSEDDCILGDRNCTSSAHCAFHPAWARIRGQMLDFLRTTMLGSLEGKKL